MSYFDDASLVMIPSGYKDQKVYSVKPIDGSGDLTFSRASNATRVNSSGLVEKVRTNVALYSEDLTNAYWTKIFSTVTSNAAANPLNGAVTADAVIPSTDNDVHRFRITQSGLTAGLTYTFSFYAKASGYNYIRIIENTTTGDVKQFDLQNGTIELGSLTGQIVSLGNGWYRCAAQMTVAATQTIDVQIQSTGGTQGNWTGNGTSGVLFFGCQLEASDIATDYIATTTAAVSVGPVSGLPRLDYSGGASCPSLLLEPSRTNVITSSEHLGSYSVSNVSVSYNNATSPEGVQNATLVTGDAGTLTKVVNFNPASNGAYTISVFAKYNSHQWIQLGMGGVATYANFDIQNGVVGGTNGTSDIEDYGNGWYRCSVQTVTGTPLSHYIGMVDSSSAARLATSSSTNSFWAYGMQSEIGSYATSYIPTLSTAVTRVADDCKKTSISSLIGQTAGTVFYEFTFDNFAELAGEKVLWYMKDGGSGERYLTITNSQVLAFVDASGGPVQANLQKSGLTVGTYKVAIAYANNDFVMYVNGTLAASDTSGTVAGFSTFGIQYYSLAAAGRQMAKQALLFKTRLSNADLATLTA